MHLANRSDPIAGKPGSHNPCTPFPGGAMQATRCIWPTAVIPSRASLFWSSFSGHRLRWSSRLLLHGYWRQVIVIAVEPDSVVSHEETGHILPGVFNCHVTLGGHPL